MGILKEQTKWLLNKFDLLEPVRRASNLPKVTHNFIQNANYRRILFWNAGYRLAGAEDSLPIPPADLINLVVGTREISWFLRGGIIAGQCIVRALQRNGMSMDNFNCILDFGCGCGRIIRNWNSLKGPNIFGTDYNSDLIKWCQKNLSGLAQFKVNGLSPPLDYDDEKFDFIYHNSVFTHMTEELQLNWMKELMRVLRKGGLILFTTHGESRLHDLDSDGIKRFKSGQLVIKKEWAAGTNLCAAFHPEQYVRNRLLENIEIVDFIPRGARHADQDVWLIRKPS